MHLSGQVLPESAYLFKRLYLTKTLLGPLLFYDNIRDGTSQDRGVQRRRIAPNKMKREQEVEGRKE